jgi:glycosyltransferase involved in cell wall biosynthesis
MGFPMQDQQLFKISDYLNNTLSPAETIELDRPDPVKQRQHNGEINTVGLSGFKLKLVEFYNTIIRLLLGDYFKRRDRTARFTKAKNDYINYLSKNLIIGNNSYKTLSQRIFLDVSYTMTQSYITGIPRVVTELAKNATNNCAIPVFLFEGNAYYFDFTAGKFDQVQLDENAVILYPDASWNYPEDIRASLEMLNDCGGKGVVLVHDIIPLQFQQLSNENHVKAFKHWLSLVISKSNRFICVSMAVANELEIYINTHSTNLDSCIHIGWAHLGSNFDATLAENTNKLNDDISSIHAPYFLSVGTIEPRKGYAVAIDAMDHIWGLGVDATYVIVGKYGWSQSLLRDRILAHSEFGKRLFWYNSATDYELLHLYRNALALVSTTLCEGFGLPVIEAAHNNLAAIVSDIPVFREIGGSSTQYFEVTNDRQLAQMLIETLQNQKIKPNVSILSWKESADNIFSIIRSDQYQLKVDI